MTNAIEIARVPMQEGEPTGDPFSSDVFGSKERALVSDPPAEMVEPKMPVADKKPERPSWTSRLPKVSRKLLKSSFQNENLIERLPDDLIEAIEGALSEVVFAGPDRVDCKPHEIVECDLFAETAALTKARTLGIQIVFEPTQSNALVFLSERLVHFIIDEIFGASGHERSNAISPIEVAIVEFLAARAVSRINESLGDELFSVGEASLAGSDLFSDHESGAKAAIDLRTDRFSQPFQVLLSRDFHSGLSDVFSDPDLGEEKAAKLFGSVVSVPLRAQIGSTRLDTTTLSFLEPGDVVIVEESRLEWDRDFPKGEIKILAGAGRNFVLTGEIVESKDARQSGLRILLKDISSREAVNDDHTARFIMEEKKQNGVEPDQGIDENLELAGSNEISESLENLQLRLRVELAGKKISLREINNLHAGQVIDLARGPTDSVSLVTDGSDETVAVGELVDIDGRLGVRITKVFL